MNAVPASLRLYRDDLVAAIDRELERTPAAPPRRTSDRAWTSRRGLLLLGAAVVGIVLLVVTLAAPWRGNPTVVDRAEAALLVPGAGKVLYESVIVHSRTPDSRRIVTRSRRTVTHVHVWLDGAPTHRFRITFSGSRKAELGGRLGDADGVSYRASDNVLLPWHYLFHVRQSDLDPAAFIRAAIKEGRAEPVGRSTLRGHKVTASGSRRRKAGFWYRSRSTTSTRRPTGRSGSRSTHRRSATRSSSW